MKVTMQDGVRIVGSAGAHRRVNDQPSLAYLICV